MLLRFPQILLCRHVLQSCVRNCNRNAQNLSKVKVLSVDEDNSIKISFRYGNSPAYGRYSFRIEKETKLEDAFKRIKLMVNIQKKKEELRRSVISKYSAMGDSVVEHIEDDDDVNISLIKDDSALDINIKNEDAWMQGQILKIGDTTFEIQYNTPTVVQLTLPENIVANCLFRPHFILERANMEDCEFHWYRSKYKLDEGTYDITDDDNWIKVSEGFMYQTTLEDVGYKLKLICIPKDGDKIGIPFSTISRNEVEPGVEIYPFEERQQFTRELADSDCIRCISYNILANVYVETRRFPYCTKKARDVYFRKQLLLRELPGYNADIICMQEVQERVFDYDILPVLKKVNMDGYFVKKGGKRFDGLVFMYRTTKFKVLKVESVYLNEIIKRKEIFTDMLAKVSGNFKDMSKLLAQDTALQLVLIQHLDQPNKKVLVANTHLYSNKDMPEVRLFQAALCTSYAEYMLKSEQSTEPIAFVFCGDFNSLPESAAYNFMMTGSYECLSSWKNASAIKDDDTALRHNLSLKNACGTPEYTNYTEEFFGCLDYIFYSQNDFDVTEVIPFPPHEKITEQVALPSEFFPSDHLPLICTLKWKSWNDH